VVLTTLVVLIDKFGQAKNKWENSSAAGNRRVLGFPHLRMLRMRVGVIGYFSTWITGNSSTWTFWTRVVQVRMCVHVILIVCNKSKFA
jgi:hypothetical protein